MLLRDILAIYRPESHGSTRGDTWPAHAVYLWQEDPDYMAEMHAYAVLVGGWFGPPMEVDDGVAQDAHHRLVTFAELGWFSMDVPVKES